MPQYLIYFNQQWVGDHTEEWYVARGPLARAVVADMSAAGVLVFAGGLEEEIEDAYAVDPTGGAPVVSRGPVSPGAEYVGGMTLVDVADEADAVMWAKKIAEACGWPQEMRRFKP